MISSALAVSACSLAEPSASERPEMAVKSPTQLELSIGLRQDEWGRYTLAQLAQIKSLLESDDMTESERHAQIAFIKRNALLKILP